MTIDGFFDLLKPSFPSNCLHKPPALPVRIEKVLPLPGEHGILIYI